MSGMAYFQLFNFTQDKDLDFPSLLVGSFQLTSLDCPWQALDMSWESIS